MNDSTNGSRAPRFRQCVWASAALFAVTACQPAANGAEEGIAGTSWKLAELKTEQGAVEPVAANARFTAAFGEDGNVVGQAECNQYSGRYESGDGGTLKIAELAATLMACEPSSIAADALPDLARATRYTRDGERLRIAFGAGGELVFEKQPSP